MNVIIVHRAAKKGRLRTVGKYVRVRHIAQSIDKIRHIVKVVFHLLVESVYHQPQINKIHVPVIKVGIYPADGRRNIMLRNGVIPAHLTRIVKGFCPVFQNVFSYCLHIFHLFKRRSSAF